MRYILEIAFLVLSILDVLLFVTYRSFFAGGAPPWQVGWTNLIGPMTSNIVLGLPGDLARGFDSSPVGAILGTEVAPICALAPSYMRGTNCGRGDSSPSRLLEQTGVES